MKYQSLFLCVVILFISVKSYSQEPVEMSELLIEKTGKKPKLKTIKYKNNNSYKYMSHDLFYNNDHILYLIDSLPEGNIQEIELYFSEIKNQKKFDYDDYKSFKVNKTEFEVTIYEVNNNYTVGNKVNAVPIPLVFEEIEKTKLSTKKVKLDITPYNFKAHHFYIGIKKITKTTCDDCYYYAPELYKTEDKNNYISIEHTEGFKKQDNWNGYRLRTDIITLTSYY